MQSGSTGAGGPRIVVRTGTPADAKLLAELGARTFRDTFAADNTEADMAEYLRASFSPDIQAGELADADSAFLIAEAEGEAVGYARVRTVDTPACVGGRRPVEIVRLYADAGWIGRGVGAALMAACLAFARSQGADVACLDVWERNARAIAFYRRWGFEVVGDQTFTLGSDVQHDLVMARALS